MGALPLAPSAGSGPAPGPGGDLLRRARLSLREAGEGTGRAGGLPFPAVCKQRPDDRPGLLCPQWTPGTGSTFLPRPLCFSWWRWTGRIGLAWALEAGVENELGEGPGGERRDPRSSPSSLPHPTDYISNSRGIEKPTMDLAHGRVQSADCATFSKHHQFHPYRAPRGAVLPTPQ